MSHDTTSQSPDIEAPDVEVPDNQSAPASRLWEFQPISGAKAFQEVVYQITYAIRSGIFAPGDRLPQIEELARDMHVSRVTIGDALKILNNAGMLKSKRGMHGGTTVQSAELSYLSPEHRLGRVSASPRELIDARRAIEVGIAEFAARRGTEEDFAAMEQTIRQLRTHSGESYAIRVHYDHLFHYAMGRAARSKILAQHQHDILEELFRVMRPFFAGFESVEDVADLHQDTLDALRSRDIGRVRQAMDRHLSYLEIAAERNAAPGPAAAL
jgi:DNA-binding FadR family transcriptional regulator